LTAGLIALVPARFADAAALQVSPIRLDLSAERPVAALTLHNDGTAPMNAQVRVFVAC
jgi:fimbrial chaperone protein